MDISEASLDDNIVGAAIEIEIGAGGEDIEGLQIVGRVRVLNDDPTGIRRVLGSPDESSRHDFIIDETIDREKILVIERAFRIQLALDPELDLRRNLVHLFREIEARIGPKNGIRFLPRRRLVTGPQFIVSPVDIGMGFHAHAEERREFLRARGSASQRRQQQTDKDARQ